MSAKTRANAKSGSGQGGGQDPRLASDAVSQQADGSIRFEMPLHPPYLVQGSSVQMPMTAGAFPLRIRTLSSWNSTSRVQCRPFFHPGSPRRDPAGPLHQPDGRDVVAHGVLPTTAGTGALGLHPDQAVQVEPSLLTGVFAQIDATVDGGYEGMAKPVCWRSTHQSVPGVWPCFTLPHSYPLSREYKRHLPSVRGRLRRGLDLWRALS